MTTDRRQRIHDRGLIRLVRETDEQASRPASESCVRGRPGNRGRCSSRHLAWPPAWPGPRHVGASRCSSSHKRHPQARPTTTPQNPENHCKEQKSPVVRGLRRLLSPRRKRPLSSGEPGSLPRPRSRPTPARHVQNSTDSARMSRHSARSPGQGIRNVDPPAGLLILPPK